MKQIFVIALISLIALWTDFSSAWADENQKMYSKGEAYRMSDDKAVLHYGEGFYGADITAKILNDYGYNAVAIPGGPPGQVQLWVGRNKNTLIYSQRDHNEGEVGHKAKVLFRARIGEPKPTIANGQLP